MAFGREFKIVQENLGKLVDFLLEKRDADEIDEEVFEEAFRLAQHADCALSGLESDCVNAANKVCMAFGWRAVKKGQED